MHLTVRYSRKVILRDTIRGVEAFINIKSQELAEKRTFPNRKLPVPLMKPWMA
jgi:hypothetical protein